MIRLRLILWNTIIIVIVACGLSLLIAEVNRSNLYRTVDAELNAQVDRFLSLGSQIPSILDLPTSPTNVALADSVARKIQATAMQTELVVPRFFDADGTCVPMQEVKPWDVQSLERVRRGESKRLISTVEMSRADGNGRSRSVRVSTVSITNARPPVKFVQFAVSLGPIEDEVLHLRRTIMTVLPIAILCAIIVGFLITDRSLKPIRDITKAARDLREMSMHDRLPVLGRDEIAELSRLFNDALDRNEASYERLLRFTADASHELRSPLTSILAWATIRPKATDGSAELHDRLDAIRRSADDMGKIIDDLLFLARLDESSATLTMERVSVASILGTVSDRFIPIAGDRIQLNVSDRLEIFGNALSLERLFANLVENSFKYGSESGEICIEATRESDEVCVEVRDSGPGIDPDDLNRIFDRFYRVDVARTRRQGRGGAGLGLNICKGIVEAHGGTISVTSIRREGTSVFVRLPTSAL